MVKWDTGRSFARQYEEGSIQALAFENMLRCAQVQYSSRKIVSEQVEEHVSKAFSTLK